RVADRLVRILEYLEVEPPYLLVGHSLGGVYVRGFAVYYPEKLAGLVIVDPGDFTETLENRREYYRP
ncbi:MAG TPA: alpha/beta hydrolase, partial [Cytophagales bacterium]|nr:alpha/beta hydrolase [Cytophagales bacterium]